MITNQLSDFYRKNLGTEWYEKLKPFMESDEMEKIRTFIRERKDSGIKVYPLAKDMFRAFRLTPYSQVRVVIIGQDPYHTHGVADGLAFSSKKVGYIPPSLRNIYTEISNNLYGSTLHHPHELLFGGSLEPWARQGVLLLNTAFTVNEGEPASHAEIWKPFTDYVIKILKIKNGENSNPIIYLLWGAHAQKYISELEGQGALIYKAAHPSPFSANKGFFNCKHFNQANNYMYPLIRW